MTRVMLVVTAPLTVLGCLINGLVAGDVPGEFRQLREVWRYFWTGGGR